MLNKSLLLLAALLALTACSKKDTADAGATATARHPAHVNRVWEVKASNGVAPGQLYVFLSEGTMVMASPNGRPVVGAWEGTEKELTLIEGGTPYKTEVLALSDKELRLRMHHTAGQIEMTLVPAL